eukprot:CAMPEP_0202452012 /NCGR_PEP_ID=MMETSP1360-20130828/10299_1 /ASSEMBLY_ACC=CAM_ASM_000848 /TAXON_ID=515479 /ORGANISM="Licmophora paradoxa, Strain CCMP2313" /LENGTH=331 /DNA_ID=CAMNT_0049070711 /DNA_START=412 /DNA_END=1407 /DNA_ORIENTATION=+
MESTPEQTAEGCALVRVLASVLHRLVCANAGVAVSDPGQVTKFHALKAPGIGIFQYLERIHKYASCSNECFILALIYIDRLIQQNNFLLTELNVHRVVITAILLAAKFFDDAYYNNAYYAKVGGVLLSEMNGLEVDFLFRINFSLHVTPDIFHKYRDELLSHTSMMQLLPEAISITATQQPIPTPAKQLTYNMNSSQQQPMHMAVTHHHTVAHCHQSSNHCINLTSQHQPIPNPPNIQSSLLVAVAPTDPYTHHHQREPSTYITPSPPSTRVPMADNLSGLSAALQQQVPLRCSPAYPPMVHYDHGKTPHGFHGPTDIYWGPILTSDINRN